MVVHEGNRSNRLYQLDEYFEDAEAQRKVTKQPMQGTSWRARIAQAQM
jgi:hypothetical protein